MKKCVINQLKSQVNLISLTLFLEEKIKTRIKDVNNHIKNFLPFRFRGKRL